MVLSLVICTYNRSKFLENGLKSLLYQVSIQKQKIEVIVIDNNSTDITRLVVEDFQKKYSRIEILYFLEKNQGISFSRNRAIKVAKGNYIAFVDDDATVDENWLETLLWGISNIKADVYGGPIYPNFESSCPDWIDPNYFSRIFRSDNGYLRGLKKLEGFPGGNLCIKSTIFDKIGLFNTRLGMTGDKMGLGEEPDLFNRLYHHSYNANLYNLANMSIHHHEGNEKMKYDYVRKRIILSGEQFVIRLLSHYKSYGLLLIFLKISKQLLFSIYFFIQIPFCKIAKFHFLKCCWIVKGIIYGIRN